MKYLQSFGVELEGMFNINRQVRGFDGTGSLYSYTDPIDRFLHSDGSVCGRFTLPNGDLIGGDYDEDDSDLCGCGEDGCPDCEEDSERRTRRNRNRTRIEYRCREWSSPPISLRDQPDWPERVTEFWPDSTNQTCGMHMHVAFCHPRHYARLVDIGHKFQLDLVDNLANQFDTVWRNWPERENARARFEGSNNYCEIINDPAYPTRQFFGFGPDRYTAVNFTAWRRYGTVELRILPAIREAARGVTLISHTLQFVENFMNSNRRTFVTRDRRGQTAHIEIDEVEFTIQKEIACV